METEREAGEEGVGLRIAPVASSAEASVAISVLQSGSLRGRVRVMKAACEKRHARLCTDLVTQEMDVSDELLTSQRMTPLRKVVETGTVSSTTLRSLTVLNPVPVMVTWVPPPMEPRAGETLLM